jgi:hypothetical protein
MSTTLNICYQITSGIHIALQSSYIRAFLKEYTQENGSVVTLEKQDYQNLSRIDFSFGLYYSFWHRKENLR